MEPTCHRCGAPVESGTLFCKQCGAPQIRVAIEGPTSSEPPLIEPSADTRLDTFSVQQPSPVLHWSESGTATFLAGLLEALFTLFGLGILAGGFFSVALYRRRNPDVVISTGLGARLGLISGAIGFGIFAVLRSLEMLIFHTGGEMRQAVMRQLEQTAAQYSTPEAQQTLQYLKTPEGWALIVALSTIFAVVAFLGLSTFGGMVGGAALGKKDHSGTP